MSRVSRVSRVLPLPADGVVLPDARGGSRTLRVSWHHEEGLAVLSVWREGRCVATVQLAPEAVAAMVDALAGGLAAGYDRTAVRATG